MSRKDALAHLVSEKFAGNQANLARAIGRSPAVVWQYLNGHREMGEKLARHIEQRLRLPHGWMDQDHSSSTALPVRAPPQLLEIEADDPVFAHVRRARIRLSAGVTGYAIDYDNGHDPPILFRRDWLASRGLRPDRLIVMRVSGSSMEPGLHDGDTIVVNLDDTNPKDGEVFAVDYEGELVVKRLRRDQGIWFLTSDNADKRRYQDKTVSDGVALIGRVVQKQSEHI